MIICEYKRIVSEDNGPFGKVSKDKFKTDNELEAYKVIKKWNERGEIKTKTNTMWRYSIISCYSGLLEDWDNKKIPYHTESNC